MMKGYFSLRLYFPIAVIADSSLSNLTMAVPFCGNPFAPGGDNQISGSFVFS